MVRNQRDNNKSVMTSPVATITTKTPSADYAWQDPTTTTPFGLATQNEADSSLEAIRINQLRILEIENALKEAGILN